MPKHVSYDWSYSIIVIFLVIIKVIKHMFWCCLIAHGLPHHHVVRLKVVILVTNVRIILIILFYFISNIKYITM
jgi:hypothetical protein